MMRLELERKRKGWSKSRTAREAGLNQTLVSQITNGRLVPYPSQVLALASALGFEGDPELLMEDAEESRPDSLPEVVTDAHG